MKITKKLIIIGLCTSIIGGGTTPIYASLNSQENTLTINKEFYYPYPITTNELKEKEYTVDINFQNVADGIYGVQASNGIELTNDKIIEIVNGHASFTIVPRMEISPSLFELAGAYFGSSTSSGGSGFKSETITIYGLPEEYSFEVKEKENEDFAIAYKLPENTASNKYQNKDTVTDGKGEITIYNIDKNASLNITKKSNKETNDEYDFSIWTFNNLGAIPLIEITLQYLSKCKTWDDIINLYGTKNPFGFKYLPNYNLRPILFPHAFDYYCIKSGIIDGLSSDELAKKGFLFLSEQDYLENLAEKIGEEIIDAALDDNLQNIKLDEKYFDIVPYLSYFSNVDDSIKIDVDDKQAITDIINYFKDKMTAEEFIKLQLSTLATVYDLQMSDNFAYKLYHNIVAGDDIIFDSDDTPSHTYFRLKNNETKTIYLASLINQTALREYESDSPYKTFGNIPDAKFLIIEKGNNDYTTETSYLWRTLDLDKYGYQIPTNIEINNVYKKDSVEVPTEKETESTEETTISEEETTTVEEKTTTSEEETTTSEEETTISEEGTTTSEEATTTSEEWTTTSEEETTTSEEIITIIDNETTYSEQDMFIEEDMIISEENKNDYEITSEVQSVENPNTGDKNQLPVWITLAISSIAILITGLIQRKRKKN